MRAHPTLEKTAVKDTEEQILDASLAPGAVGSSRPALVLWLLQFLGGLASAPVYALLAVYVEKVLHQAPFYTAVLKSIPLAVGGIVAPAGGGLAPRMGYKARYIWGGAGEGG